MTEPTNESAPKREMPISPGRPKRHHATVKTRAEVTALYSFGVPQHAIASYLGIQLKTLRKHYRDELNTARVKAHGAVAKFLFNAASGQALDTDKGATYADCVRAAIFWAKTQMGYTEKVEQQITGPDGGPVQHSWQIQPVMAKADLTSPPQLKIVSDNPMPQLPPEKRGRGRPRKAPSV